MNYMIDDILYVEAKSNEWWLLSTVGRVCVCQLKFRT